MTAGVGVSAWTKCGAAFVPRLLDRAQNSAAALVALLAVAQAAACAHAQSTRCASKSVARLGAFALPSPTAVCEQVLGCPNPRSRGLTALPAPLPFRSNDLMPGYVHVLPASLSTDRRF